MGFHHHLIKAIIYIQYVHHIDSQWTEIWYDDMESSTHWTNNTDGEITFGYVSDACQSNGCCKSSGSRQGRSWILRVTNISSYGILRLQFSVSTKQMESGDACTVYYSYKGEDSSSTLAVINPPNDGKPYNYYDQKKNFTSALSKDTIWIWLENEGTEGDYCYWDNVYMYGIETATTNDPSQYPTTNPSNDPSNVPTNGHTNAFTTYIDGQNEQTTLPLYAVVLLISGSVLFAAIIVVIVLCVRNTNPLNPDADDEKPELELATELALPESVLLIEEHVCIQCGVASPELHKMDSHDTACVCKTCKDLTDPSVDNEVDQMFDKVNNPVTVGDVNEPGAGPIHDKENQDAPIAAAVTAKNPDAALVDWLEKLGVSQYVNNFAVNGYETLNFVKEINDAKQLEDIDVVLKGHQIKILNAVKQLLLPRQVSDGNDNEMQIEGAPTQMVK
eukprot:193254_1